MSTLKYTVGSAMASATMLLAPAVPVAASSNTENSFNNTTTNTSTVTETNSGIQQEGDGKNFAVWGNCSGIFYSYISQSQSTYQGNTNDAYVSGEENKVNNDNNQSSSSSQWATGITFSPDCSVHNVTNVQQAAAAGGQGAGAVKGAARGAQAEAAKGGVGAGVGGAVGSSLTAILGVAGSIGSLGLGLRRFGN